jgi:hypothetical protein
MELQNSGGGNSRCSGCSREFAPDDLVHLNNKWICGECKPLFLRMLQEGLSTADITVARSRRILVMGKNAMLPGRCIKCNAPANPARLRRNLSWHNPAFYLLVLINILVYAIVAIIIRKKAVVDIPLCDKHIAKRRASIMIAWMLVLAAVALIVGAIVVESGLVGIAGGLLFLGGLIYAAVATPVVKVHQIDKEYVWLKGICNDYLNSLPEWVKPR